MNQTQQPATKVPSGQMGIKFSTNGMRFVLLYQYLTIFYLIFRQKAIVLQEQINFSMLLRNVLQKKQWLTSKFAEKFNGTVMIRLRKFWFELFSYEKIKNRLFFKMNHLKTLSIWRHMFALTKNGQLKLVVMGHTTVVIGTFWLLKLRSLLGFNRYNKHFINKS